MSDDLQIFDVNQNSDEWHQLRCGIPTASEFKSILAKGEGKTRRSYLLRVASEIITGQPAETFESPEMLRGRAMEDEARRMYAFMQDCDPQQVGFCRRGFAGCSPDSFVGDDGAVEIKTKKGPILIDCILANKFPAEHVAQCQGVLWITGRKWIDLCAYWPGMPLFVKRAERDEEYIARLAEAVRDFNAELAVTVERIRQFSAPPAQRLERVGELLRA